MVFKIIPIYQKEFTWFSTAQNKWNESVIFINQPKSYSLPNPISFNFQVGYGPIVCYVFREMSYKVKLCSVLGKPWRIIIRSNFFPSATKAPIYSVCHHRFIFTSYTVFLSPSPPPFLFLSYINPQVFLHMCKHTQFTDKISVCLSVHFQSLTVGGNLYLESAPSPWIHEQLTGSPSQTLSDLLQKS